MAENYPKLKILSSEDRGKILELKKKTHNCGRSDDNDFILNDTSISSKHCVFERNEFGYTVIDNDSTNGTLVNNMTVSTKSLKNEDIVTVGNVELLYDSGDLKQEDTELTKPKAAISLGEELDNIPLGEMKNFSPFAEKKGNKTKILRKIMLFACIGLVVAAAGLLVWILLTSI
jgi:pSer/pThr/pTyr-binding forkhead associated (FHA) protein